MSRIVPFGLLGGLGLTSLLVVLALAWRPRPQQSSISWDKRVQRLGTLASGQPYRVRLRFTNNTGAPATLLPEPCCGVEAAVEPPTVEPGRSGVLRLEGQTPLSTDEHAQRKIVRLQCRELPGFVDEVGFEYTVQPNWHPVPAQLGFDGVDEGSQVSRRLRIYLERGAAPLVGAESASAAVSVKLSRVVAGDYYDYTVAVRCPPGQHGQLNSEIRFRTADARVPFVAVPIVARIRSCAAIEPERLSLDEFPVGRRIARTARISSRIAMPGLVVAEMPEWATVRLRRLTPNSVRLRLVVRQEQPGAFVGEVRLRVTTTHTFEASLPVTGMATE